MAEKQMNARVILKNDTSENWSKAGGFTPKLGELIIYTDTRQFKIGDGVTNVVNLPFVSGSGDESVSNKVTALSSSSTDSQYPSAKCVYDGLQSVKGDIGTINISTTWTGSASPYNQTVTVTGATVTASSKVDLLPSAGVIAQMINDNCNALYISNNNGVLTLYAVGAGLTVAQSGVQVCVTEVTA